jgi:hypothetical protein
MRSQLAALGLLIATFGSPALAQDTKDTARRIQTTVLGVDAHNDTVQRVLYENVDLGNRLSDGAIDIHLWSLTRNDDHIDRNAQNVTALEAR